MDYYAFGFEVIGGTGVLKMAADILIVDDSKTVRTSLCHWLKLVFPSWSVEEARDGQEAIDCVLVHPPRIVIMDIGMPGMNGIEATRRIKTVCAETKVVMLTIYEDAQYQVDASLAGASAYVTKHRMHTELIPILTDLLAQPTIGAVQGASLNIEAKINRR
jgi:two-component system, NarL family, response regulator DegU